MTIENEIKHLVGTKVINVNNNIIYFDDGTSIEFHPYETYVYKSVN